MKLKCILALSMSLSVLNQCAEDKNRKPDGDEATTYSSGTSGDVVIQPLGEEPLQAELIANPTLQNMNDRSFSNLGRKCNIRTGKPCGHKEACTQGVVFLTWNKSSQRIITHKKTEPVCVLQDVEKCPEDSQWTEFPWSIWLTDLKEGQRITCLASSPATS